MRYPLSGTFEVTARCNLRCGMCLVRVDEQRIRELGGRELTAAQWVDLARQAADMGTVDLLLTGGEPTLRPDFAQIYEAVARMGFHLTLYTNATLLSGVIRDVLSRFPPHSLGVTVYGASPGTYGRVCGSEAAYGAMRDGLSFLAGLPSKLDVRTTIIRDNLADLDAMRALAESFGEGTGFTITNVVSKAVRGGVAQAEACRLSPREQVRLYVRETLRTARALTDERKGLLAQRKLRGVLEDGEASRHRAAAEARLRGENAVASSLLGCGAGMDRYAITWDGRLIGCEMLSARGADALESGLRAAWEAYPATVPALSPCPPACAACAYQMDCSVCPAVRLAESGSLDGIPLYNCGIAEAAHRLDPEEIRRLLHAENL